MQRTLYAERLYSLGDFKNIKFSSAITDIPEEVARNEKVIGLMYMNMYLSIEISYRHYYELIDSMITSKVKDVIEHLELERTQTMQELKAEMEAIYTPSKKPAIEVEPTEKETI